MTFGKVVQSQRKHLGLTMAQLASRCGIDRTYISKIENHSLLPSFSTQNKISKALGIKSPKIYLKEKVGLGDSASSIPLALIRDMDSGQLDEMQMRLHDHIMQEEGTHHRPFAVTFIKKYGPNLSKDEKSINELIKYIKKWRAARKTFWQAYYADTNELIEGIRKSKR